MKHIIRLILSVVIVTSSVIAGDENPFKKPHEIPAKIDSEFKPEAGIEYTIASPWLYHRPPGGSPGPAQARTSTAWSVANEFIYRTALATLYAVPATQAGPMKAGWFQVFFNSIDGKSRLVVEVDVEKHLVRLPQPERQQSAPAKSTVPQRQSVR